LVILCPVGAQAARQATVNGDSQSQLLPTQVRQGQTNAPALLTPIVNSSNHAVKESNLKRNHPIGATTKEKSRQLCERIKCPAPRQCPPYDTRRRYNGMIRGRWVISSQTVCLSSPTHTQLTGIRTGSFSGKAAHLTHACPARHTTLKAKPSTLTVSSLKPKKNLKTRTSIQ